LWRCFIVCNRSALARQGGQAGLAQDFTEFPKEVVLLHILC